MVSTPEDRGMECARRYHASSAGAPRTSPRWTEKIEADDLLPARKLAAIRIILRTGCRLPMRS